MILNDRDVNVGLLVTLIKVGWSLSVTTKPIILRKTYFPPGPQSLRVKTQERRGKRIGGVEKNDGVLRARISPPSSFCHHTQSFPPRLTGSGKEIDSGKNLAQGNPGGGH